MPEMTMLILQVLAVPLMFFDNTLWYKQKHIYTYKRFRLCLCVCVCVCVSTCVYVWACVGKRTHTYMYTQICTKGTHTCTHSRTHKHTDSSLPYKMTGDYYIFMYQVWCLVFVVNVVVLLQLWQKKSENCSNDCPTTVGNANNGIQVYQ